MAENPIYLKFYHISRQWSDFLVPVIIYQVNHFLTNCPNKLFWKSLWDNL